MAPVNMNTQAQPETVEPPQAPANTLTIWGDPESPLKSQYGEIRYEDWCKHEVTRIRKAGGDAVVGRWQGFVAVQRC